MMVIVVTLPDGSVENEAERITAMLRSGAIDRVHIRKPGTPPDAMRKLISKIPKDLHSCISIHSNPELLKVFSGLGWHFSQSRPRQECTGLISRSCHSPSEAARWTGDCDYVTLSPVFDSISKHGYLSACFNTKEELLCCLAGTVVALGGVTPDRFPQLKERGYKGAAMLGYAWNSDLNKLIEELKCYNS